MKKIGFLLFLVFISISFMINLNNTNASSKISYIIASKINLRAEPSLQAIIKDKLIIGTPVKKISGPIEKKWCKIHVVDLKTEGYTYCEFISDKKPTLKEIDKQLLATKDHKEQLNYLQRKFYLSPSINTLLEIKEKYKNKKCKMDVCIEKGLKFFYCDGCHYFKAYKGILQGSDFRPIISNLNSVGYKNYKQIGLKFYQKSHYNITYDIDSYKKLIYRLPKIKSSLFKSSRDIVLGPGTPYIYKYKIIRSKTGKAEVHYKTALYSANTTINFIELSKKLTNNKVEVSPGPPIEARYGGLCGLCGISNFQHNFLTSPKLLILTRRKILSAKIVSARVTLINDYCKENESYLKIAVEKPIYENILYLLFVNPDFNQKISYKVLKYRKNFWLIDLNNDDIADIAGIISRWSPQGSNKSYISKIFYFTNINGSWMFADCINEIVCT